MIKPDYSKYNLALIKDDEIIYTSKKGGIRPIVECVIKYKDKIKGCDLHDKVIGLAAAKVIVYSGMFKELSTRLCSTEAVKLLMKEKISFDTREFTEHILNMEKTAICPMEEMAMETDDCKEFFNKAKDILKL